MSTITYYRPTNTYNLNDWGNNYRTLTTATHAQTSDGIHTTDLYGIFSYNSTGITGGTLTGMTWSQNGTPYFGISGLNLSVLQVVNSSASALDAAVLRGNDTFNGSYGNDGFYGYTGNDTFNGGAGIDTVFYDGSKSSITATPSGSGYKVTTLGKTDTLNGIERIEAGNGSILALDVKTGENTGSAYRAYQAAFDRKPDLAGLNYWVKQMDNGMSLKEVAKGFVNSTEFKTLNPSNDTTAILNSYYQHVLHRAPDAVGQAYWSAAMNSGTPAYEVLAAFSESTENIAATAPALNGGIWLS
jgi:Ca2+-binding RTX toxin-like protein